MKKYNSIGLKRDYFKQTVHNMRKFGQGAIIFIYTWKSHHTHIGEQGLGTLFFAFMKTKKLKDKTVSQAFKNLVTWYKKAGNIFTLRYGANLQK